MAKNKKKGVRVIVIALVGAIVLFVVAKKSGWIGGEVLTKVEVVKPEVKEIVELISANGKIQPVTEVKIAPDVSGEIVELNVEEGDVVERGDLLLKIKPDVYESIVARSEASLNSSKAQLQQIEVEMRQAKIDFERNEKLYRDNAITLAEFEQSSTQYDNLVAQYDIAKYGIESSEAALKESSDNLQKTTIYAPVSGTVSLLSVEVGERVVGAVQMTGTEMLRLADLSKMEVLADVNENDIVRVSVGDTAIVEVDAYVGRVFKGVVTQIANSAKTTTTVDQITNFEVKVFVLPESYEDLVSSINPNPLRPGMSTSIDIVTERKSVVAVPIQSVTLREKDGKNREVLFVYNEADSSKVETVDVVTGIQDINDIEIVEGVDTTQTIVSGPYSTISRYLKDGQRVSIKEK